MAVQNRRVTSQSQVSRDYAVATIDGGELDLTFGSQTAACSAGPSCDYSFSACQLVRLEGVWYRVKGSFEGDGTGQVRHQILSASQEYLVALRISSYDISSTCF